MTTLELTEAEFDAQYTPIVAAGIAGYEDEVIRPTDSITDVTSKHLWTVLDDGDIMHVVSGFQRVNSLGYVITEEAWTQDTCAVWADFRDTDADPDDDELEDGDFDEDKDLIPVEDFLARG